ncbi:MAG: FAD binding domain-containing protein [Actinomycetota bacterium]|nr:FAD binding domain-containing protein [Actinomycetota bacterium]
MSVLVPRSLADCVGVLGERPDALVLAGGTDLMVEVNESHRRIDDGLTVVAVNRVPELRSWTLDRVAGVVRIGAGVTYTELAADPLAGLLPALAQAARTVGSPQIRNAATIGGNVATCSPAGDGLPVLAALEADVELASASGVRSLPIAEFMLGVKKTAREPGELITAVTVPLLDGWQGYVKVGVRNAMVIAISGACLAVDTPSRSVRLALGSVAPTIIRVSEAERLAAERVDWATGSIDPNDVAEFGRLAAAASRPIDDHRSTAAYRRHSIEVLARRLLARAFEVHA